MYARHPFLAIFTLDMETRLCALPEDVRLQVFTSDHALKLEWIPDWVAIIGSGYIGLEFSDVYTALGSEVTFIEVRLLKQPILCSFNYEVLRGQVEIALCIFHI